MNQDAELLLYFAANDCSCHADFIRVELKHKFEEFNMLVKEAQKNETVDKPVVFSGEIRDLAIKIVKTKRIPAYTLHIHHILKYYAGGLVTEDIRQGFIDYINTMDIIHYMKHPISKHAKTFISTRKKLGSLGKTLQTSIVHQSS